MDSKLVYYGCDVLKHEAAPVTDLGGVDAFVDMMFRVMKKSNGIGLAAPQVGDSRRIITIDLGSSEKKGVRVAIINPVIERFSGDVGDFEEGCLSVPGIYADVVRPLAVSVRGLDPAGREVRYDAEGLFARVLQHEIDHLDGILFIDRIEDFVRKEFTRELKNIKKLNRL